MTDNFDNQNPRLNEIYQLLLLAGYFRIRIASLQAFDKVLGGVAWCITSSNFQIDIQYNDEMHLGQKIKVSESICDALSKMGCPYSLQPFQLQGLDVNNIYPIVQWLVKFVYETRAERGKYDRELSVILGKGVIGGQRGNFGVLDKKSKEGEGRIRINRAIQQSGYRNPIRVYSALLEYNDATASKMYNKLLNIMTGKGKSKGKGDKSGKGGKQDNLIDLLGEDNQQQNNEQKSNMNQFGNFNQNKKISFNKLERIIIQNKNSIQQGLHEHQLDQQFMSKLAQSSQQSQSGLQPQTQQPAQNLASTEQQRWLKQAKNQNKKYQQKIEILRNQLTSFQAISQQLGNQIAEIQEKYQEAKSSAIAEMDKNNQYREAQKQIAKELKANKQKISPKLQKLVQKRQVLKSKKAQTKKKAKSKLDQLSTELQIALLSVPQIDQQAFKQMIKQAQLKKQIYTSKYQQLTLINQQLAVLQRRAQASTSPPQLAQYHQRFVQLFQSINILIEQKRTMFFEQTNTESLKKVITNYLEILNNIKSGYLQLKKKGELKEFVKDLGEIWDGMEGNRTNSQGMLGKVRGKRESVYAEYMGLMGLQREYLGLVRMLKIEYENAVAK